MINNLKLNTIFFKVKMYSLNYLDYLNKNCSNKKLSFQIISLDKLEYTLLYRLLLDKDYLSHDQLLSHSTSRT